MLYAVAHVSYTAHTPFAVYMYAFVRMYVCFVCDYDVCIPCWLCMCIGCARLQCMRFVFKTADWIISVSNDENCSTTPIFFCNLFLQSRLLFRKSLIEVPNFTEYSIFLHKFPIQKSFSLNGHVFSSKRVFFLFLAWKTMNFHQFPWYYQCSSLISIDSPK